MHILIPYVEFLHDYVMWKLCLFIQVWMGYIKIVFEKVNFKRYDHGENLTKENLSSKYNLFSHQRDFFFKKIYLGKCE